jgi:hypothetical protein
MILNPKVYTGLYDGVRAYKGSVQTHSITATRFNSRPHYRIVEEATGHASIVTEEHVIRAVDWWKDHGWIIVQPRRIPWGGQENSKYVMMDGKLVWKRGSRWVTARPSSKMLTRQWEARQRRRIRGIFA